MKLMKAHNKLLLIKVVLLTVMLLVLFLNVAFVSTYIWSARERMSYFPYCNNISSKGWTANTVASACVWNM